VSWLKAVNEELSSVVLVAGEWWRCCSCSDYISQGYVFSHQFSLRHITTSTEGTVHRYIRPVLHQLHESYRKHNYVLQLSTVAFVEIG